MTKDQKPSLYDELAPKVGHENFMRAYNHIAALVEELIALVPEAEGWGSENGHPEVESYPQYSRVREIGIEFNKLAGLGGMQKALSSTQKRLNDYPPKMYSYAIVVFGWSGVGSWQP